MKRTLFLKSLTSFVISLTLFSCQDHLTTPTGPQRFRLKRIINSTAQSPTVTTTLNYNSAGKLLGYTEGYSTGERREYALQYNGQGRLVSREAKDVNGVLVNRAEFDSDANGNITAVRAFFDPNSASPYRTLTIEYGADKLPVKVTTTELSQVISVVQYSYNGGNIVSNNAYDNSPNPYYGLIGLDTGIPDLVNRNNEIQPLYTYDYNSNGLLTRVAANRLSAYESYEYEPY